MKKLKGRVIRAFLCSIVLLSAAESTIDYLLEELLLPYYAVLGIAQTVITMTAYITVNLILLAVTAWLFSNVIGKGFEEEMHRQMNERNMLYANITHDLKTPITSILGFASVLKDNKADPKQQEQVADTIYQKAKRTDELLNMLFEYTKLGTEGYQPSKSEIDLCAVLRNVTAMHYEEFERKNIELEIDIPDSKSVILCNEQQMTRAIENLVINAYKHNKSGSRAGIFLKKTDTGIFIDIADDGRKMSEEEAEGIFEPFVSGDVSRNSAGGSGLGLAIAKRIVEIHGGRLRVEQKGDGYTKSFRIQF